MMGVHVCACVCMCVHVSMKFRGVREPGRPIKPGLLESPFSSASIDAEELPVLVFLVVKIPIKDPYFQILLHK